jgi:predicted XRE-type DNA-binding protein
VFEIAMRFDTDAYRTVYAVQIGRAGVCIARLSEEISTWDRNAQVGRGSDQATLQIGIEDRGRGMTKTKEPEYEIGSGNVFADLGLDDADELLTRAQLGHTVRLILKARKLKQREIGELLGIDQAEVSKLMNGQYHVFAEGRLFAFLKSLEQKVTIQVSRRRKGEPYQEVMLAS